MSSTCVKPETVDVGTATFIRLLGLTKIISSDLEWFNLRLLLHAQVSMLVISAGHDLTLVAGIIKYVSSAYFDIKFPGVTDRKSDAVTTYEAGPMAEPWIMLAVIDRGSDFWSLYLVHDPSSDSNCNITDHRTQ